MAYPPNIIIGDVTITPLKRLPSANFTASANIVKDLQRSQDGSLYSNKLYTKYTIAMSGLAQGLYEDLREQAERSSFIDLYSITTRREVFSASGATNTIVLTRKQRLDDDALRAVIEYPIGTTIPGTSISTLTNVVNNAHLELSFTPGVGTRNIACVYYPIITGTIGTLQSNYDWTTGEETWDLTFEEM